jgi:hypothetical protein
MCDSAIDEFIDLQTYQRIFTQDEQTFFISMSTFSFCSQQSLQIPRKIPTIFLEGKDG